ncbi:ATP-dependent RecD-like DNA helicase, partial [Candidatus Poribacteria bacterium]|nr:ATP-dependent RecD-like DNA helicase [Candidatus Poribacteria bacterium]
QKEAIKKTLISKVMILTGGPGTGKTTTLTGIIKLMEQLQMKVVLGTPTGRAAKRLGETTSREAKTIHRLLEFAPGGGGFKKNQLEPLDADVVIIDESSMVDLVLMNNLLKAIKNDSILILVGDVDQLPSVGAGNVLKDLIDSGVVEVVTLTEIFRQAQKSMIVTNAHKINKGEFPSLSGEKDRDFFFIEEDDPENAAAVIVDLVTKRLPKYYKYDPIDDIQVLCPMYKGSVGADNFNQVLQNALNPDGESLPRGGRNFRSGDKVMQIRNNYDKEVFNGDIGRIASVDIIDQVVTVAFPEKEVVYDAADLDELVLAYAITIHKSQGSEYKAVVIPVMTQHYMMLQRNLLYTGITRAKNLVVIVGSKKALGMAIRNNKVAKRYTSLAKRLQDRLKQPSDIKYPHSYE